MSAKHGLVIRNIGKMSIPQEHTKINLCSKKSKYLKANDYLRKDSESEN